MTDNKTKTEEVKKTNPPAGGPKAVKAEKTAKVSAKVQKLIDEVGTLSVLELADLVKALEDKFGVASAPVAMAAAPVGVTASSDAPQEEKTEFNVILTSGGANKIAVIKIVRELKPELGLKEAKDLVEAAPKELLKGVKKEQAEEAKKKLTGAGAQVEIK